MTPPPAPQPLNPLIERLLREPRRFTFFQAVRLLERITEGKPLGYAGLPREETIRLRGYPSLGFPAWDIDLIEKAPDPWKPDRERFYIDATFLGIYGPASPLPSCYTDMLIRPQDNEDPEDRDRVRAFLDIFQHRLLSFMFRSLSKYRYHLSYSTHGDDTFSGYMLSLIGRGTRAQNETRPVLAMQMLRYAGLLTQAPRSAQGLQGILRDYLGLPVNVQQCTGRWLRVEDKNEMGKSFCRMGEDLIVGANVYDRTGKFRISVGPMGMQDFMRFLPNGELTTKLKELVRLYLIDHLDFDLEVWLKGDEVPPLQFGGGIAPMLGWTSWSLTHPGPDRAVVFQC